MINKLRERLEGLVLVSAFTLLLVVTARTQLSQTAAERLGGPARVTTEQLRGTVAYVEENNLVVRMAGGEIREFQVPATRKFRIDGEDLSVGELRPGTKLAATVKTTTTSITGTTTALVNGRVWWVSGNTIIITLPNNESKMYTVESDSNFTVNGKNASIDALRRGMQITAEKVVEAPYTEVASDTVVTGHRQ